MTAKLDDMAIRRTKLEASYQTGNTKLLEEAGAAGAGGSGR